MPKHVRALIVDDSRLARVDLRNLLAGFPQVEVVAEANSVAAAVKAIEEFKPELIFLDIKMPGESGFDLLDKLEVSAKIVFVTAFDQYAIRAFEVNALDYLLKPVAPDRLAQTLERLDQDQQSTVQQRFPLKYDDLLFVNLNNRYSFLRVKDILRIASAGPYTEIMTSNGQKGLMLRSMKDWEARLPEQWFVRIHRTTIINVEYVEKIEEWFNHSFRVFLKGLEKPVVMSRRHAASFRERMG
jgi:two-component system LytT family response regulator